MGDLVKLADFLNSRKESLDTNDKNPTFCVNCGYFIGKDDYLNDIKWEESLCGALKTEVSGINPINGMPLYFYVNGDGDIIHTDKPNPYTIDINPSGSCEFYKKISKRLDRIED